MSLSKMHHLYWGTISHHRHTPFNRFFKYPIFMAYVDISNLASVMRPSMLWNINKPAIVSYRRQDYHGDPAICLLYTSPSPRDLSTSRMPSSA